MNIDIPLTKIYIKEDLLTKQVSTNYISGYWYGVTSIPGRMFGCSLTLENGANWSRIPLEWLSTKPHSEFLVRTQTYDCFSYNIQMIRYNFLRDQEVLLLKEKVLGKYLFTIDSFDELGKSPFSEFPEQHKNHHFIELHDGQIVCRPNNFIRFIDMALYDTKNPLPFYKRIDKIFYGE